MWLNNENIGFDFMNKLEWHSQKVILNMFQSIHQLID